MAEEAPAAYKDVSAVVEAANLAGLSRRVAKLKPLASKDDDLWIFVAYEIARLPTIRALFWLVTVRFRPISDSDRDDPVRNYIAEAEHIRPRSRQLH
jgi:hypothetical protein